jgi:histidine ammonia-lyase
VTITLDGSSLAPGQLLRIVDGAPVSVDPAARARVAEAHETARRVATRRPVYGRTTGVGANLGVAVDPDSDAGLRLIRSHAGGAGALVPERVARAMMVVRANQLLAGASGADPTVVDALISALSSRRNPAIHEFGSLGTADLTAMAELALTLIGERPWLGPHDPVPPALALDGFDALPLLSSSALTIAQSALAQTELWRLVRATAVVAALSFTALQGSPEAFAPEVQAGRPHEGSVAAAARMRELIGLRAVASGRIQDPYGLRAFPPVQGVLLDAMRHADAVLTVELNAAAENPFVSVAADDVFHHGGFHQAPLAAALDSLRLALLGSAQLTTARISALFEPRLTELTPFLAAGPAGSSGLLVLEYTAAGAVAALRAAAMPVALGSAVLSRGAEEHASFAPQAARLTVDAVAAYRIVLAVELVAAVRALRLSDRAPAGAELSGFFEAAAAGLSASVEDRPLDGDLVIAAELLDRF